MFANDSNFRSGICRSWIHLATETERWIWFLFKDFFFFFSQWDEKETLRNIKIKKKKWRKKGAKKERKTKEKRKTEQCLVPGQHLSPQGCWNHASALHHAEHTLKPHVLPYEAAGTLFSFQYNYLAPFPHFPLLTYQTEPEKTPSKAICFCEIYWVWG